MASLLGLTEMCVCIMVSGWSKFKIYPFFPAASPALRMVLEAASEARKLETENAHLWKYSKHLLKYIKNQQKEINKSEK